MTKFFLIVFQGNFRQMNESINVLHQKDHFGDKWYKVTYVFLLEKSSFYHCGSNAFLLLQEMKPSIVKKDVSMISIEVISNYSNVFNASSLQIY